MRHIWAMEELSNVVLDGSEMGAYQEELTRVLKERYPSLIDLDLLRRWAVSEGGTGLSDLFLCSAPSSIQQNAPRVMIVGKETRGWGRGLSDTLQTISTSTEYIDQALKWHADQQSRPIKKSKFFQFFERAEKALRGTSVLWANLLCLSHNGKSPRNSSVFDEIQQLSGSLLQTQIEVFSPDALLFVTGATYDKLLGKLCSPTDGVRIEPRRLWSFKVNGIPAYRANHPQCAKGTPWRIEALQRIRAVLQAQRM